MESTPGEDVLKIVNLTADWEYYINLVEKAVAVFEDWVQFWKKFERWHRLATVTAWPDGIGWLRKLISFPHCVCNLSPTLFILY